LSSEKVVFTAKIWREGNRLIIKIPKSLESLVKDRETEFIVKLEPIKKRRVEVEAKAT